MLSSATEISAHFSKMFFFKIKPLYIHSDKTVFIATLLINIVLFAFLSFFKSTAKVIENSHMLLQSKREKLCETE